MPFRTPLIVQALDKTWWRVYTDLVYVGPKHGDRIVVPKGSQTDFASVPKWLQSFIQATGAWTKAAVVHDHLCDGLNAWHRAHRARLRGRTELVSSVRSVPRPTINAVDTDGIFRAIMREEGVNVVTRWLMWAAVRWGALANPARREGWLAPKQALPTLGISAATLAAVGAFLAAVAKVAPW